jgi:hypothetical protein
MAGNPDLTPHHVALVWQGVSHVNQMKRGGL